MEVMMAEDTHELSETEQLEQRLQVTTKFVVQLTANLVANTSLGLTRGEVGKIIRGLKPAEREGLSPEEKARSEVDGWQVDLIEREFQAQLKW